MVNPPTLELVPSQGQPAGPVLPTGVPPLAKTTVGVSLVGILGGARQTPTGRPPMWSFPRPKFVTPAPQFVIPAKAGIQRGGVRASTNNSAAERRQSRTHERLSNKAQPHRSGHSGFALSGDIANPGRPPRHVIPVPQFVILAKAGIQRGGEEGARSPGREARQTPTGRPPMCSFPRPKIRHSGPSIRHPGPPFVILAKAGIQRGGEEGACTAGACPQLRVRRPAA